MQMLKSYSQIQQVTHANMPELMSNVIIVMRLTLFGVQSFFVIETSRRCL